MAARGRPRGEPSRVVRLPVSVLAELEVRAAKRNETVGEYLRAALAKAKPV